MFSSFVWYWFRRELRTDRIWIYGLFMTLGIAALTLVDLFSARVLETSLKDTKKFMGADYMIRSWREPPAQMKGHLLDLVSADPGAKLIEQKSMLVSGTDDKNEVYNFSVTGTEPGFPLYGTFRVEEVSGEKDSPELPAGAAYVDSSLKARGFAIGQHIRLGKKSFAIAGFILEEPQSTNFIGSMGYRVVLNLEDLRTAGLIVPGARVSHRFLLKTHVGEKPIREAFRALYPDKYWRLISVRQGSAQVARLTGILSTILLFFAVLASLMGALTTYFLFRLRILRKLPELLTLKCLGLKQSGILRSNLLLFFFLAGLGILSGFLLGVLSEEIVSKIAAQALGAELSRERPWLPTLFRVCFVSFLSVLWATYFPLRDALNVPVNQIFSADQEGLRAGGRSTQIQQGLGLLTVALLYILIFSASLHQALITFGGLAGAALASLGIVEILLSLMGRYAMAGAGVLKFLLVRAVVRNPLRSRIIMASLLLGITAVGSAFLVTNSLRRQIAVARSDRAADLVVLTPDDANRKVLSEIPNFSQKTEWLPYSQARVYRSDGQPIREIQGDGSDNEESDEIGIREYFVNYRGAQDRLTKGENLVGRKSLFAAAAPGVIRLSLEKEFAGRISVGLGDELKLQIGGVQLNGRVDSFREVNWFNFSPNFFIVAALEDLEGAPRAWIGLSRFDDALREMPLFQRELVKASPQSLALDTQMIATRVIGILNKIDSTVFWISLFLSLTLLVLVRGISSGRKADWGREKILLKSLGLREKQQKILLIGEMLLLWSGAWVMGILLSVLLAILLSRYLFKFPLWAPEPVSALLFVLGFAVLMGISMIGADRKS
jgi:putative ABC transport system permease protein